MKRLRIRFINSVLQPRAQNKTDHNINGLNAIQRGDLRIITCNQRGDLNEFCRTCIAHTDNR